MSNQVYTARSRGVPSSAGNALLAIFNQQNSGKVLDVNLVRLEVSIQGNLAGSYPGTVELRRISALDGGNSLTPTSFDTNNQAIPAGVIFRENAVATLTADEPLHQVSICPNFRADNVLCGLNRIGMGLRYTNQDPSVIYQCTPDGSTLPIKIGPGEGLAMHVNATPLTTTYMYSVTFKIAGGNETYIIDDMCGLVHKGQTPFAIFNGHGSAVIEVWSVELREAGDYSLPVFIGIPIGGLESTFSDAVTPTKLDSSSPEVPSGISIYKDCPVIAVNAEVGSPSNVMQAFHSRGMIVGNILMSSTLGLGGPSYFASMYTTTLHGNWFGVGPGVLAAEMFPANSTLRFYPGYGLAIVLGQEDSVVGGTLINPQLNSSLCTAEARINFSLSDAIGKGSAG